MKSQQRINETGEVFTPFDIVDDILNELYNHDNLIFDPLNTYLDPACGHGNFLVRVFDRKNTQNMETLFGVDIMADNVCDTIARLKLLELTGVDPFDPNGVATTDLNYPGHDNKDFDYLNTLSNLNGYYRKYRFKGNFIFVCCGGKIEPLDGHTGAFTFLYKINDDPAVPCKNIVCADGTTFGFNFDYDDPRDHIINIIEDPIIEDPINLTKQEPLTEIQEGIQLLRSIDRNIQEILSILKK